MQALHILLASATQELSLQDMLGSAGLYGKDDLNTGKDGLEDPFDIQRLDEFGKCGSCFDNC